MNLQKFLSDVSVIYKTGAATEHSYRAALQKLLSSIGNDIIALNEPKCVKCGAPDFIVSQGDNISDIYAETITYGMFAARLHDTTLDTFSRQEPVGDRKRLRDPQVLPERGGVRAASRLPSHAQWH